MGIIGSSLTDIGTIEPIPSRKKSSTFDQRASKRIEDKQEYGSSWNESRSHEPKGNYNGGDQQLRWYLGRVHRVSFIGRLVYGAPAWRWYRVQVDPITQGETRWELSISTMKALSMSFRTFCAYPSCLVTPGSVRRSKHGLLRDLLYVCVSSLGLPPVRFAKAILSNRSSGHCNTQPSPWKDLSLLDTHVYRDIACMLVGPGRVGRYFYCRTKECS